MKNMITINQWDKFELTLPVNNNPKHFTDSWVIATFNHDNQQRKVYGFYDDQGHFIVRFMPDIQGEWTYTIDSNLTSLTGQKGQFQCIPARAGIKGPVRVDQKYHFCYANGEVYYPFGTTAYVWNYQSPEIQAKTLASLAASPFNKIRMCVFPKHYTYNFAEPSQFPFPGNIKDGFDTTRFNHDFFTNLETQINQLEKLNIEADLILFHPYDRWGFAKMSAEVNHRYINYIVARFASFRNVWWSLANEYDLLTDKPMAFWDSIFAQIFREDAVHHPLSIHNWHHPLKHHTCNAHWYDHSNPLVSHASIQHHDMFHIPEWRDQYQKPILIDECRYEGNIDAGWGNITAERMVELFWSGVCLGGYVTHGETYLSDDDIIWWSHGGTLKGSSVARIAFLRKILEEKNVKRLSPQLHEDHFEVMVAMTDNADYGLLYFGASRPKFKNMTMLPKDGAYQVDIIDTWGMRITPHSQLIRHGDRLELPGTPYIALRVTKVTN